MKKELIGSFEEAEDIDIDFYKYQESLPIGLNEKTGLYEYMTFIHTDLLMDEGTVYTFDSKNIIFYQTRFIAGFIEGGSYGY